MARSSNSWGMQGPSTWAELEARLSGRPHHGSVPVRSDSPPPGGPRSGADPTPASLARIRSRTPYAELHCHSNFSFLDGASDPDALVAEADRLDLAALALTDRNGLYGIVRFAEAARVVGLPTVFGAELVVQHRGGERQIVVLADGPRGYAHLARAISIAQLNGSKNAPRCTIDDLAAEGRGHWWVLTGTHDGIVPRALVDDGPAAAARELHDLADAFGRDRLLVELWDHGDPLDSARNDALVELAVRRDIRCVAATDARYATPAERRLATALAAVRRRSSLTDADPWLPVSGTAHLRSGDEQMRRFARYPGVVETAAEIGRAAAFDLSLVAPNLPPYPCPDGLTEMQFLRRLAEEGASRRYGQRPGPGEDLSLRARAWRAVDHELSVIETLGFAGYFLVVWDIVQFCIRSDIYCQGRGSAANSAVCYSLGITKADAVSLGLLFERFLSPERDGPPDIDLDIESGRREEVIQYVYERYGRHHTAQVANVITYRARSAVRDMARALGYAPGQQDAWSKQIDRWGRVQKVVEQTGPDGRPDHSIPADVLELAARVEDMPRHLGIHSGGMVICDRPVIEVCPVEWATMRDRSVLQWDKDDCAAAGLVKFDLLGLGMLSALHGAVDLVREAEGIELDLATLPQDDDVYAMLCRADTVGVFQIESRAQMATLPRLKPRRFYDLVVEVALIRPGPIQGGSVHPYIRRRNGQEPITYLHPLLENSLGKTLGVPLFQEQLMQMAIDVAGFTPAEADQLRQAMGSKRSAERMRRLRDRLYEGMAERGVVGPVADEIFDKMAAFANYGFPESHSVSFAYLVYASSWLKLHHPAAFYAGLLNAQPMGFWSPHSLAQDARRHGVVVRTPDLAVSAAGATLEHDPRSHGGFAVRLGLGEVRGVGSELATAIVDERRAHGDYVSIEDLARRVPSLTRAHLEALSTSGAFTESLGVQRREALWIASAAADSRPGRLAGVLTAVDVPRLPGMEPIDEAIADLWATGIAPTGHPTQFLRARLDELGVVTADRLATVDAERVWVAGVVTHRQRPATAQGTTFMNLEDETGLINVVVSVGCWKRFRATARGAASLLVRGRLQRVEGVVNIVADHIAPLRGSGEDSSPSGSKSLARNWR